MILSERYEVREDLAQNEKLTVYQGFDRQLNVYVTIRILNPAYSTDPRYVRYFLQRAEQASAQKGPPKAVAWGADGDIYYVVMEWIEGADPQIYLKGAI